MRVMGAVLVLVGKRDQGCVGQMVPSGTCGDFFPSHGATDRTSMFPSLSPHCPVAEARTASAHLHAARG